MAYFIAAYITKQRFTVLTKNGGGDHKRRLSRVHYICTMHCVQCTLEKQCTAHHVIMNDTRLTISGYTHTYIPSVWSSRCLATLLLHWTLLPPKDVSFSAKTLTVPRVRCKKSCISRRLITLRAPKCRSVGRINCFTIPVWWQTGSWGLSVGYKTWCPSH